MRRRTIILLLAVTAMFFLCGCGGEKADNPIKPGGEVPELLASLPDDNYLALGYLDFGRLVDSEIGRYLLNRFSLYIGLVQAATGVNLEKDIHELAFAVRFNEGAYPKLYRALPIILAIRADLEPEKVLGLLNIKQYEKHSVGGHDIYRCQFQMPMGALAFEDIAFLSFPEAGLILLSTSSELLESYYSAHSGEGESIETGGTMNKLLGRIDKRVPGWMAVRHSKESRTLLRMLAGFDDCLISARAGDALQITCVMDFPAQEDAEEVVKRFEFTRRQLKDLFSDLEEGNPAVGAWNEAIQSFEARRSMDLAIFSARFNIDWFNRMLQPTPAEETGEPEIQ